MMLAALLVLTLPYACLGSGPVVGAPGYVTLAEDDPNVVFAKDKTMEYLNSLISIEPIEINRTLTIKSAIEQIVEGNEYTITLESNLHEMCTVTVWERDWLTPPREVTGGPTCVAAMISFEMSPTEVYPVCTPEMTLRCAVNSTSSNYTPGMANVHWNALIVKSGVEGVAVASVTYAESLDSYTPAKVFENNTNIAVEGSLLINDDSGFLEVTWTDPMFSLNGWYECVANGLDAVGNQVSFSYGVDVLFEGADAAEHQAYLQAIFDAESEEELATITKGVYCGMFPDLNYMQQHDLLEVGFRVVRGYSGWTFGSDDEVTDGDGVTTRVAGTVTYVKHLSSAHLEIHVEFDNGKTINTMMEQDANPPVIMLCLNDQP